jgi:structure-specific recognition protein 1
MTGETYEILVKLFKHVAQINRIITPGDFRSALDMNAMAIRCSVKVSEGYLYPLNSSLIFIQKPIIYIKHKEIMYVEF